MNVANLVKVTSKYQCINGNHASFHLRLSFDTIYRASAICISTAFRFSFFFNCKRITSISAIFNIFQGTQIRIPLYLTYWILFTGQTPYYSDRRSWYSIGGRYSNSKRMQDPWSIYVAPLQRVPTAILQPAADRISYVLGRGTDGALAKEGNKGSANDSLSVCVIVIFRYPFFADLINNLGSRGAKVLILNADSKDQPKYQILVTTSICTFLSMGTLILPIVSISTVNRLMQSSNPTLATIIPVFVRPRAEWLRRRDSGRWRRTRGRGWIEREMDIKMIILLFPDLHERPTITCVNWLWRIGN